jgi:hypothetical protein
MRITSAGNVGIGTTAPNEALEIANSTGGRFIVSDSGGNNRRALLLQAPTASQAYARLLAYNYGASAGMNLVLQDAGGSVGIGTTSPGATLDVVGTMTTRRSTAAAVGGTLNIGGGTYAWQLDGNRVAGGDLSLKNPGGSTVMYFPETGGNVGIGTTSPTSILDVTSADNGTEDITRAYALNQTQGVGTYYNGIHEIGSNGNNSLRIDSQGTGYLLLQVNGGTGNVGIGTAGPTRTLEVNGGIKSAGWGSSAAGSIMFGSSEHASIYGDASVMALATNGGERIRIDQNGNVGINDTSPNNAYRVSSG